MMMVLTIKENYTDASRLELKEKKSAIEEPPQNLKIIIIDYGIGF